MKKYEEFLKVDYKPEELAEMSQDLARATQTRGALEQQKKQVDAQLKAQIEEQNTAIGRLAASIVNGCEWRNVECRFELDTPSKGRKRIVRMDTGEEVRVVAMTDDDRQMALDLEQQADAEEAAKTPPVEPIVTPPPYVQRIDAPGVVEAVAEPVESAPLAQAAVMGGTHQRKQRRPRDAKAEAAADGSGEDE